eukprot:CAMPEP_0197650936 /NCGR_PEP_ID=MMETSP1338-20131121/31250_1 /TAXON_ID=43686 ORGANISM="Pelagodinium beii, Strain RCC1491" /NCGR_SAMPLE_ID=MMETSP1338 /ASSEMBLY_ACC=CAM_ASM_000754 /LENGTH=336 /DNA_ID=CAMNT_0043225455 /DNA_START=92 /DNA_END=1103 /DNA_ORIENTATION=+
MNKAARLLVVTCIAPLTLAIEQTDISQSEAFVAKQGQVTPASTVASIKPATAANGRAKSIVLSDVDGAPVKGGKAVFIPSSGGCNAATPDTAIGDDGKGTFTIAGQPGSYKLCYQAPGQTDSIEQTPVSGTLSLTLVQATTVSVEHVTEMHPMTITVNVQTDIKFPEAGPGDLAYFVNTATADCTKQVPPTQVGLKHNLFRITSTGTYALCYRTPGAPEAVAQANVSLKVIPQGVKEVMVNQWVRKDGAVDCTSLKLVSHCGFTPLQQSVRTLISLTEARVTDASGRQAAFQIAARAISQRLTPAKFARLKRAEEARRSVGTQRISKDHYDLIQTN